MKYLFVYGLIILSQIVFAQLDKGYDQVIQKNKKTIKCKVLRVNEQNVEVDPKGSTQFLIIPIDSINSIIYRDHTTVHFNKTRKEKCRINMLFGKPLKDSLICDQDTIKPAVTFLAYGFVWYFPLAMGVTVQRSDTQKRRFYFSKDEKSTEYIDIQQTIKLGYWDSPGIFNLNDEIRDFSVKYVIFDNYGKKIDEFHQNIKSFLFSKKEKRKTKKLNKITYKNVDITPEIYIVRPSGRPGNSIVFRTTLNFEYDQ